MKTGAFPLFLLLSLCACSPVAESTPYEQPGEIPLLSPNVVYAIGWSKVTLLANSATTQISTSGHYSTDRNLCQLRGDAAYDVLSWNALADLINQVVLLTPLATPKCAPIDTSSRFYNPGKVELVLDDSKKITLFEMKEGQLCTSIDSTKISTPLFSFIEKTIDLADRADAKSCPNYRP